MKTSIQITGKITELPPGKEAPDGHEMTADWWQVIGKAPGGDDAITNIIAEVDD